MTRNRKNVLDIAFDRLKIIFNNFKNIYFAVSGVKDNSNFKYY